MVSLGEYTLYTVETGRLGLDGGAMFGIVPKPLWSQKIEPDDQNRIPLHMRCLLLEGRGRLILVDTGIGDTFVGTKYRDIYAVDTESASLQSSLAAHGFGVEDVTDVVLTHLHFDHCGGSTRQTGEGHEVVFPNATFHVQSDHWAWAMEANPKEKGSFLKQNFAPIEANGQLHLVDGAQTLFDGVEVILAHGHTESQQLVKVTGTRDNGTETTLVYVADLLPTTHHLAPAWTMAYDVRPLTTIDEKATFLEHAADAEWNLFFEHDPEVAVSSLHRTDRGVVPRDPRSLRDL